MKKVIILIPVLFLYISSNCQSLLMKDIASSNQENIVSITIYKRTFQTKDSIEITAKLSLPNSPVYKEYFGSPKKLTRKEYYNETGEIRSAYDIKYSDKLIEEIGDTLYKNRTLQTKRKHINDNLVEVSSLSKTGEVIKYFFTKDFRKNTVNEYSLNEKGDTAFIIYYTYNENDEILTNTFYKKNKKTSQSYYVYDENGVIFKTLYFDSNGELLSEMQHDQIDKNELKITYTDYKKDVKEYSRIIKFKDQFNNTYKEYSLSKYDPDNWHITYYSIEYK